jgi:hypothetical protein
MVRILIALYPRRWRQRYGAELAQLIDELDADRGGPLDRHEHGLGVGYRRRGVRGGGCEVITWPCWVVAGEAGTPTRLRLPNVGPMTVLVRQRLALRLRPQERLTRGLALVSLAQVERAHDYRVRRLVKDRVKSSDPGRVDRASRGRLGAVAGVFGQRLARASATIARVPCVDGAPWPKYRV